MKKIPLSLLLIVLLYLLPGCTKPGLQQYTESRPEFDLFDYFNGDTRGWGIVQKRNGTVTRQFVVDITGTITDERTIVLNEQFVWDDGEESERIWTIVQEEENHFSGTAGDVVGKARGKSAGNALNWNYIVTIEVDGKSWDISFDDWMFLQPDGVLLNRAEMSKFGIRVGEVTIAFKKESA